MAEDDPEDDPSPPPSRWRGLVIMALLVGLVAGVWFISQQLRQAAAIQDCVATGRTNCAPVSPGRS